MSAQNTEQYCSNGCKNREASYGMLQSVIVSLSMYSVNICHSVTWQSDSKHTWYAWLTKLRKLYFILYLLSVTSRSGSKHTWYAWLTKLRKLYFILYFLSVTSKSYSKHTCVTKLRECYFRLYLLLTSKVSIVPEEKYVRDAIRKWQQQIARFSVTKHDMSRSDHTVILHFFQKLVKLGINKYLTVTQQRHAITMRQFCFQYGH